jgi:hypothetical protein
MRERVRVTGDYVNRVYLELINLIGSSDCNVTAGFYASVEFEFGFRPFRARYFLLLAQEKVPKEKGTRWLVRA